MKRIKLGEIRTVHRGKIFTVKEQDVVYPDGSKDVFEYCQRPASVTILAFNKKGEVLLIKEYRHRYKKSVWFLPGGRVDAKGDTSKKAAMRELREETGYRADAIKFVHKKFPSNTLLWDIYLFAARDLVWDPLPKDKGEYIKVKFIPFKKAVQMAMDGTIDNEFISYNIIRFDYMVKNGEWQW